MSNSDPIWSILEPDAEVARLMAVAQYRPTDTKSDDALDRLVSLAARVGKTPVALISLVGRDKQFFRAKTGTELCETPREVSFCAHALAGHDVLVVLDATADNRFSTNPLVVGDPGIRFYAGAPLVTPSSQVIGTVCVIDFEPRQTFSESDRASLADIAALVMQQLELQRLQDVEAARQREQTVLRASEHQFRLLVGGVSDYSLYMLSPAGIITSWNLGAERIKGYTAKEVVGEHFSKFYTDEERKAGVPERCLKTAAKEGRFEAEGWRVRKDGTRFWANVVIDAIHEDGKLIGFAKITRDITERRKNEERLFQLAHFDTLTGLFNRYSLRTKLTDSLERSAIATVFMLDLDGFKDVNDTLGHAAGDSLLREAGGRIQSHIRDNGIVGRLGGDEFAVIVPGVGDPLIAGQTCQQLIEAFRAPFYWEGQEIYVAVSIGVAIGPNDGADADELLTHADLALYQAKSEGHYSHSFFRPSFRQSAVARRDCEQQLRQAIAHGELELFYQPKVRVGEGRIIAAEALLRWRHPERGLLAPNAFLSVLDRSTLAPQVGDWVLQTACQQAAEIRKLGLSDFWVAVNLFGSQFRRGHLVQTITGALDDARLTPDALELEITENIIRQHDDAITKPLQELQALGVFASFDDFGTGYASLSLLKRFPLRGLKIDRGFVRDMCCDPEDAALVKAVIDLGRSFGLEVTAEGVETEEQAAALLAAGCEFAQGYLYGRPMPAHEIQRAVRNQIGAELNSGSGTPKVA